MQVHGQVDKEFFDRLEEKYVEPFLPEGKFHFIEFEFEKKGAGTQTDDKTSAYAQRIIMESLILAQDER